MLNAPADGGIPPIKAFVPSEKPSALPEILEVTSAQVQRHAKAILAEPALLF
jgi:hypothetical protein